MTRKRLKPTRAWGLKLLPCPFCDGEAKLQRRSIDRWHHIECSMCHSRTMVCGKGSNGMKKEMCFKIWNTRTLPKKVMVGEIAAIIIGWYKLEITDSDKIAKAIANHVNGEGVGGT